MAHFRYVLFNSKPVAKCYFDASDPNKYHYIPFFNMTFGLFKPDGNNVASNGAIYRHLRLKRLQGGEGWFTVGVAFDNKDGSITIIPNWQDPQKTRILIDKVIHSTEKQSDQIREKQNEPE